MTLEELKVTSPFDIGEPNTKYAQFFDGQSYLKMLSLEQVVIGNVTFEVGCRNHWHVHHASSGGGQILICTAGRGYYQAWGEEPIEMKPGDVVNIPANVKRHFNILRLKSAAPGSQTNGSSRLIPTRMHG